MKQIVHFMLVLALGLPFSAFAIFEQCRQFFPEQQTPISTELGQDLCFDEFAIYYSPIHKKPIYTVEKLNGPKLEQPRPRRTNQFYEEARLPQVARSSLSDYRGSGFDRGHNVPAGDMTSEQGMAQSFSLANMMPQARKNNQGIWAKNVEEPTRQYAKRVQGDLYVYTGSTGSRGVIGKNRVTIPMHLYKLVYDPQEKRAWAYWVENTDDAVMSAPISYQELEKRTGIQFHLPISAPAPNEQAKLGGWYPVFFEQYSEQKVDNIIANIKAGRVTSIEIHYDANLLLATELVSVIEGKTSLKVKLVQQSLPDSPTTSYKRNQVSVIVRSS
jgi:endonuclease G, mitochondrial